MQVAAGKFCRGCGTSIGDLKSYERRVLSSEAAKNVKSLWEKIFSRKLAESAHAATISLEVAAGNSTNLQYMCRKCYQSYERFCTLENELLEKAATAISKLPAVCELDIIPPVVGKRPCPHTESEPPCKRPHFDVTEGGSPAVVVHVGYKKPKSYVLTPTRKHMGKHIARGSRRSIALQCWKDENMRSYILKAAASTLHGEVAKLCSQKTNSLLKCQSAEILSVFRWDELEDEMRLHAPTLTTLLQACFKTKIPRQNCQQLICLCVALMCKNRRSSMSLIHKIVSLILYAGHSSKQVFCRLHKLGLTLSYPHTLVLLDKLGSRFDVKATEWRENLLQDMNVGMNQNQENSHMTEATLVVEPANISGSFCSNPNVSFSSINTQISKTSTEEIPSMDVESLPSSPIAPPYSPLSSPSQGSPAPPPIQSANTPPSPPLLPEHQPLACSSPSKQADLPATCYGYKLVGDNIDKTVKPRYMRSDRQAQSLHYFHFFAVKDRVPSIGLSDIPPSAPCHTTDELYRCLMPSNDDSDALHSNFETHVARILVTHLPVMKLAFDDIVDWHIKHPHYKQMSQRSDVVPLGILPHSETKHDEMIQIMASVQQYVPVARTTVDTTIQSTGNDIQLKQDMFYQILFGGDQLTVARARGSQHIRMNSDTAVDRLLGLIPVTEDWHTSVVLLRVIFNRLYHCSSSMDYGTLYQLRNLVNRRNVVRDPKKNFNACNDFFCLVVTCHVIAAGMKVLGMEMLDSSPTEEILPHDTWMLTENQRKPVLKSICHRVVKEFTNFHIPLPTESSTTSVKYTDQLFGYAKELLSLGLFYMEYNDAVREGDGNRVLRCWRYLLPLFKYSGRKNYSIEAFNLLYSYYFVLSPRQSHQLLWSRFVNTSGLPGRNIACDLHMEHLNRLCKDAMCGLGANKTLKAITRIGKCIGVLKSVLENYDETTTITEQSGKHSVPSSQKDRDMIINQLLQRNVFEEITGRTHSTFRNLRSSILSNVNYTDLSKWMTEHVPSTI